ncbi:sn-glycerol-3-phosphate ABC transporter ATP-binding protein UgpC [Pelagibius litoralis]|uniref:Sn-glycerol-3-phosphate ABC transporter ATP-binding protein UgpC n=1 Tax=Pelagibius litoralis TaxID=374515 RepID=A0A967EYX1_9PROT|nr:sn-glycerol-3-phosphate ABC transporter ATP-binding protein UgpC [Pelagibius litoralis]NIA69968.1 sn-glycerol-3-phosphate ABC transporter ATP-binding protein UgpC [Pelagibius litoralis]
MAGVMLREVTKAYGPVVVIPKLDLTIKEGEFVVIVGPSGCGKSTTLRMIAGLETVSGGSIYIAGKEVTHAAPKARDIAMVFQSYALYPHMNVAGNMSFALRLAGTPKAEVEERVRRAAEMLELIPYLDRKPKDLSGGQRQRVAMGRSIVRDAYCFLFDEPLSNLDAKLRATMRTELAVLHKRLERTMVYVTHDQIEAMTMADRIVIMEKGVIQQVGTPREVYTAPANLFVAGFIGSPSMNFLEGEIADEAGVLRVRGAGFDLPVPGRMKERVSAARNRDVTVGLRPEHFSANDSGGVLAPIQLQVDVAEYIGSSQFLAAVVGQQHVTASVDVGPDAEPLRSGDYYFDADRIYLFDRASGQAL